MSITLPKDCQLICQIGEGTYGTVSKCSRNGELVAVKRIKMEQNSRGVPATTLREVAILKALNAKQHQLVEANILPDINKGNIVNLYDVIYDLSNIFLVFEYCNTDLDQFLKNHSLSPYQIKFYMYQILNGLDLVHKSEILHRDIKPNNILLKFPPPASQSDAPAAKDVSQTDMDIAILKITDFGLARSYGINVTSISSNVVSLWYRSPELVLASKTYSTAVDVWSAGCILYFLANKKALFAVRKEIDLLQLAFSYFYTDASQISDLMGLPNWNNFFNDGGINLATLVHTPLDINIDDTGKDLFYKMMSLNPSRRLSCEEALSHPWFDEVRGKYGGI